MAESYHEATRGANPSIFQGKQALGVGEKGLAYGLNGLAADVGNRADNLDNGKRVIAFAAAAHRRDVGRVGLGKDVSTWEGSDDRVIVAGKGDNGRKGNGEVERDQLPRFCLAADEEVDIALKRRVLPLRIPQNTDEVAVRVLCAFCCALLNDERLFQLGGKRDLLVENVLLLVLRFLRELTGPEKVQSALPDRNDLRTLRERAIFFYSKPFVLFTVGVEPDRGEEMFVRLGKRHCLL